jgi:hypothetical protein
MRWLSLFLACQHLSSGTNLRECKDQSWFKVPAVPVFRFNLCKMFPRNPGGTRVPGSSQSFHYPTSATVGPSLARDTSILFVSSVVEAAALIARPKGREIPGCRFILTKRNDFKVHSWPYLPNAEVIWGLHKPSQRSLILKMETAMLAETLGKPEHSTRPKPHVWYNKQASKQTNKQTKTSNRGCRVVSATAPQGRILGFLDLEPLLFLPSSSSIVLTRLSGSRSRPTTSQNIR